MNPTGWLGGHPESGELLCYADRSLNAPEHEKLAQHLTECEYCQRELLHIENQARSVSAAMASLGTTSVSDIRKAQAWKAVKAAAQKVERRRKIRVVWIPRLAAASIAVVVLGFASGPALAFMRGVLGIRSPEPIAAPAIVTVPAAPAAADGSSMYWGWRSSASTIRFVNRQSGTIEFRRSLGSNLTVQVIGASKSGSVGRSPGGDAIIIQNDSTTSPFYIVSVPAHVTQVTISVPGGLQIRPLAVFGKRYDLKDLTAGRLTEARFP